MDKKKYWQSNLRILALLLSIWFTAGILCSIVFVTQLNAIHIAGFPLGFWFAMQGAMIIFVVLIFIYVRYMNKLDKDFGLDD